MSLTISISRTSLSLGPLVFSGDDDATVWGIMPGFTMPGRIARIRYATSAFIHGDVPTGATLQQAVLSWDAAPNVASAAALATAEAELYAALGQFAYSTTVVRNGVTSVWACDMGSVAPGGLDFAELDAHDPIYGLTIPCYPVGA